MSFYAVAKMLVTAIMAIPYRIIPSFEEEIPEDQGFILASNHLRDLDPVILGIACPRQVCYMAKKELFIPGFGGIIRALGAFPVDRGKGDTTALDTAKEIVQSGKIIGIFPEGTRSKTGKFGRIKSGTVVIASQAQADILPVAIIYEARRGFRRRVVTVKFGRMIRRDEMQLDLENKATLKAANRLLSSRIAGLLGQEEA